MENAIDTVGVIGSDSLGILVFLLSKILKIVFISYVSLMVYRISFTYGLLWEHENLNPLTHATLHEFFGYITADCSAQLALTMREKKLVSASGEDIYLPDMDKEDRLDRPAYREHINRLNMPICFIVGKRQVQQQRYRE